MSEKIYINLVPNPKYTEGSNLPVMVGPANPNAPEGKNWTIGVKMPDRGSGGIKQLSFQRMR
jgi:hypothetical protein